MCGIAGIINSNAKGAFDEVALEKMLLTLAHRGPDDSRVWFNGDRDIFLGHRRLSIIDLNDAAGQPMHYLGRYTIVFNGEIYNYLEIKKTLISKGYTFHTESDTEVLIALYDHKKEACLDELDGMFAFVIYDSETGTCFGARDRFGEKPFYYYQGNDGSLIFASEIKAFWAIGIPKVVSDNMQFNYLLSGAISDPIDSGSTFYSNIRKLPQASCFSYSPRERKLTITKYWSLDNVAVDSSITEQQAIDCFRELFFTSVKRRMRSDVPLGSSLSGGLDSSLIVAAVDALDHSGSVKRKTFSARFPDFVKDESAYQDMIINRTNSEAHFVYPDAAAMLKEFDNVVYAQDEPFGGASIFASYEVFKLAKNNGITVMLDGQGADEILGGYHGYFAAYFTELLSAGRKSYNNEYNLYKDLHNSNVINEKVGINPLKSKLSSLPGIQTLKKKRFLIKNAKPLFSKDYYQANANVSVTYKDGFDTLNEALKYSLFNKGLEELLRYADRNSMANSLEVRLPFLSHELVAYLFTLPSNMKIRGGWTKWIQRVAFPDLLPDDIRWRKDKIGYEPPQKAWLKNPLIIEQVAEIQSKLIKDKILNPGLAIENNEDLRWRLLMTGKVLSS